MLLPPVLFIGDLLGGGGRDDEMDAATDGGGGNGGSLLGLELSSSFDSMAPLTRPGRLEVRRQPHGVGISGTTRPAAVPVQYQYACVSISNEETAAAVEDTFLDFRYQQQTYNRSSFKTPFSSNLRDYLCKTTSSSIVSSSILLDSTQ